MIARFRDLPEHDADFLCGLLAVADRLGTEADFIATVMQLESQFDPGATNPTSYATGLIQFMPSTARALGTSVDDLRAMSAAGQLPWVEAFYAPHAGRIESAGIAYMLTFLPAVAFEADERIIAERGSAERLGAGALTLGQIYAQNPGFDALGIGRYTVGDVKAAADGLLRASRARGTVAPVCVTPEPVADDVLWWVLGGLGLVALARRLFR